MYYSYVEIEYVATSFSPARTDLALKLFLTEMQLKYSVTKIKLFAIGMLWKQPIKVYSDQKKSHKMH